MFQRANWTSPLNFMGFAAFAMGFGALAGSWTLSDRSFQRSFEAALAERTILETPQQLAGISKQTISDRRAAAYDGSEASQNANLELPISGSEEFWLGHTRFKGSSISPVALSGPFKLGDQLAIGSGNAKHLWTVVDLSELSQPNAAAPDLKPSILLVTLQDRTSGSGRGALMRLIVDTNDTLIGTRVSTRAPDSSL